MTVTGLDTLLTEDFVGIGPVGFMLPKPAWLDRFGPDLHYDRLELDEITSRDYGDASVVVARQHAAGEARGNPVPGDTRVSFVLVPPTAARRDASPASSTASWPPREAKRDGGHHRRPPGPPRALSWANRMLERVLGRGKGPPFLRLLTVPGRRTGQPRITPVAPVFGDDGSVWLVAAYGDTAWVRNVRAAGRVELHRGDDRTVYAARELDAVEAVPVLRAYLAKGTSMFVRRHFGVTARSTDAAIAAEAARHPTFALTPVEQP